MWSRRQPLASVGAVLSLLDGPTGCDSAFFVVWFMFRLLRIYLALWPSEVGRVYRLLEMMGEGGPGHGPIHLLAASAAEIGFKWNPVALAWVRPGLPMLSNLDGTLQHFKAANLGAWRNKVAADLCGRKGFRGGPLLDIHGSLQLVNSSHVRERDKALLRSIMVGGVWNGLLLGRVRGQAVHCRFCGAPDNDCHLFWDCPFPPLVEIRENPGFHDLLRMDKGHWPRCLLWHGWLPLLSGINCASPWAAGASESAGYLVEITLGCYSSGLIAEWGPPDGYDRVDVASLVLDHPSVWSHGSLVLDKVTGVSSSGDGFFAHQSVNLWDDRRWGHVVVFSLRVMFRPVEVSVLFQGLSSLFRELRCRSVILALQSSGSVHLGVDNLGVVRHVGRLLDGCRGTVPFELVKDGDLLLLVERMLHVRGLDTVRITAPHPMVWSAGALRKKRRLVHAVRDRAFLPGPPGCCSSSSWTC